MNMFVKRLRGWTLFNLLYGIAGVDTIIIVNITILCNMM